MLTSCHRRHVLTSCDHGDSCRHSRDVAGHPQTKNRPFDEQPIQERRRRDLNPRYPFGYSTLAGWCTRPNYATSPWALASEHTTAIITTHQPPSESTAAVGRMLELLVFEGAPVGARLLAGRLTVHGLREHCGRSGR